MTGIILITMGTVLCYVGQSDRNRLDTKPTHQSLSEVDAQVGKLVKRRNELLAVIDEYQKSLLEKGEVIQRLEGDVDKTKVLVPEKSMDEETEIDSQVITENES